jgi:sulfopyruvate decarboxylase subunit alpha
VSSHATLAVPAPLTGAEFLTTMRSLGYDFFTGVPCSVFRPVYAALDEDDAPYFPAVREDLALGLAAGAALAAARPAVLMQNSGLGIVLNALLSLHRIYCLPVLMVVSWRGWGADAPEHVEMGRSTPGLLDAAGIPYRTVRDADAYDLPFHRSSEPIALLVRPGDVRP